MASKRYASVDKTICVACGACEIIWSYCHGFL